jgi:hypothetical protein
MGVVVRNGRQQPSFKGALNEEGICSRAIVLFAAMVAPFDNVHIRVNIPRLDDAIKYGNSSGDR